MQDVQSTKIRPMDEGDLQALAQVYMRAFDDPAMNEHWSEEAALQLVKHWWQRQPDLAFTAEVDGTPVGGFIVGVRPWWDGTHLVDGELFVDPQFQKRGVGKQLIARVLTEATEKYNPTVWETYTFRDQGFPLTWYKQIGFAEISEWAMIRAEVATVLSRVQ